MTLTDRHPHPPRVSFDGGDLDCGSGLLLLIRRHIDPLERGDLLEILSTDGSVEQDLPAWCRLTGNELVSTVREGTRSSYLVCKGPFGGVSGGEPSPPRVGPSRPAVDSVATTPRPPVVGPPPVIAPLSVVGIGSWPRPRWLLETLHRFLEGRLSEVELQQTADDAVRLCVDSQARAGVDLLTDGEQRRDAYASFVGSRLDHCQLVPLTDLLPYVDDPEEFARELRALDVPADQVRHPAVLGKLSRSRPLATHELDFVRTLSSLPVKVALPGPYLLTRTMWLECVSDRAYERREDLARDVVRVLREEIADLLAHGAALVQLDEPVLTEVVFGTARQNRVFMCGALGEKLDVAEELDFARGLLEEVLAGWPRERMALHVCRGNWTADESVALRGDYTPLLPLLSRVPVGTLFLELCTPRAGEVEVLRALPSDVRVGVGVVNQKSPRVERIEEIVARAETAIAVLGASRVLLNPDCGFATFADSPVTSSAIAQAKLAAIVGAAGALRERHGG